MWKPQLPIAIPFGIHSPPEVAARFIATIKRNNQVSRSSLAAKKSIPFNSTPFVDHSTFNQSDLDQHIELITPNETTLSGI